MEEGHAQPDAGLEKPRRQGWIADAIRAGQPWHFRKKVRWKHNLINLLSLSGVIAALSLSVAASNWMSPWVYLPLAGCVFGLLYFSLFILVVHEASHGMFVILEDRRLHLRINRMFGWSCSIPFAVHYIKHWEEGHIEHHVRPLEPADPQQSNTLVGGALLKTVLMNAFIPCYLFLERTVLRKRKFGKSTSSKGVIVVFVFFWAFVLTLVAWLVNPWASGALFFGLHILSAWNHIKGSLEHGGAIGKEADPFLRSRSTFFPGRQILMPWNITLHFEHHLNFSVPWYDMVRYHKAIRDIVPQQVWDEVINHHPFAQLSGKLGALSEEARLAASSVDLPSDPPQQRVAVQPALVHHAE